MTKLSLIWSLVAAVFVGAAALTTGYVYMNRTEKSAETPAASDQEKVANAATQSTAEPSASTSAPADAGAQKPDGGDLKAAMDSLSFDVVGVEPTGETVVAGRSDAGAIVALVANGAVVGKAIADANGEWTIILDNPLKPGDYDVGLQVLDEAGNTKQESSQRLAVSVPEDGKSKPLVVLNKPDGPSDVLQMPAPVETAAADKPADEPKPAEETVVAAAPATQPAGEEKPAGASTQDTAAQSAGQPAAATGDAAPTAPAATAGAPSAGDAPADAAPAAQSAPETVVAAADPQTQAAPAADTPAQATASAEPPAADAAQAPAPQPAGGTDVAAVTQEPPAVTVTAEKVETPAAAMTATVEAVESEDGKIFVAGTGAPGLKIRIYVAGEFVGEVDVAGNGRWLLEAARPLAPGIVEVRADMIGDAQGTVVARAAVSFEKAPEEIILTRVVASGETGSTAGVAEGTVAKALPNVIIRKGDNLWNISRRLYGTGYRYTTIYQANKGQIRNPDLIYPGQVFLTPEGDLNWKPLPSTN